MNTNAGANGDNDQDPGRLTPEDLAEGRRLLVMADHFNCYEHHPNAKAARSWLTLNAEALLKAAERTQKAEAERDALRVKLGYSAFGEVLDKAETASTQSAATVAALARVAELEQEQTEWRNRRRPVQAHARVVETLRARVAELEAEVDGWRAHAKANDEELLALGSKWSSRNATLRNRVAEPEAEVATHARASFNLAGSTESLAGEADRLRSLVEHCWLHSGYPDCGYLEMTAEEKALYDGIVRLNTQSPEEGA